MSAGRVVVGDIVEVITQLLADHPGHDVELIRNMDLPSFIHDSVIYIRADGPLSAVGAALADAVSELADRHPYPLAADGRARLVALPGGNDCEDTQAPLRARR